MNARIRDVVAPTVVAMAAMVALAACDSDRPWEEPGPADVFDAFLMHYFRGEDREAFEYLAPEDREKLLEPLAAAEEIPSAARPEAHEMLVVADVQNAYDIRRMELETPIEKAPADGEAVTLILHLQDGTTSRAQLVWSAGRWYVDLPLDSPESKG